MKQKSFGLKKLFHGSHDFHAPLPAAFSTPKRLDLTDRRVYVAGHGGMVGAALVRRLVSEPCEGSPPIGARSTSPARMTRKTGFATTGPIVAAETAAHHGLKSGRRNPAPCATPCHG
jgi:hypothetical protein